MTKEEILRTYLKDKVLVEKKYLKKVNVDKLKWQDFDDSKLITTFKLAIEGEISNESKGVTIRKINQLLNRE